MERSRRGLRHDPEPMIRVTTPDLGALSAVAHDVRGWGDPGMYRLFDVDVAPQFRYCLDRGVDPTPGGPCICEPVATCGCSRALAVLELAASKPQLASDALTELTVDGERVRERDPDVLLLSSAALVPRLFAQADRTDGTAFRLGRLPGHERPAERSTYTSYGRVGHSPPRYDVPCRVVVDRSNTFLWGKSNHHGCRYLVGRSWRPLQELA